MAFALKEIGGERYANVSRTDSGHYVTRFFLARLSAHKWETAAQAEEDKPRWEWALNASLTVVHLKR